MCCAALRTIGGVGQTEGHSASAKAQLQHQAQTVQCGHPELDSIEHGVYVADFSEMN